MATPLSINFLSQDYRKLLSEKTLSQNNTSKFLFVLNGTNNSYLKIFLSDISLATDTQLHQPKGSIETESSITTLFFETNNNQHILLFDEADSLFGTRTDVKYSHDRYANIETSYLLNKIEKHAGIVIISSNQRKLLNPQLLSNTDVLIQFPLVSTFIRKMIRQLLSTST